ncbi:hypothetical protein SXCC_01621 [Gluconacetobacter sp. SXCC-1]|uniref:DUF1028 domain-containing protein n=1 Tax=Komagataeibacter rhaeticus TaxID=215221 RepID=A0A181CDQ9_9PROT|nr:DUF1028 domain-containing protein [Komagataeibacter rhaeticus]ATU71584.1 DUF1028 domain-containing protein [Komagataeibacter xylinus]EGG77677.1 hypothetical protein SXCC_01621 [Gluconacetobacter sp. SXCC-1]QIP36356.1 DUF1028 domain-containing protein [Komagataeibacter rhaeticus]QOC46120.1 DUF1028 domain-containing protein [Komagataeibacter rhaeticus]WPP21274.1 DUF1028 domain-containing protein [Komagataeibacter rhaeticus]
MTFSIIARCARTGQFGIAVSSSSPAVASRCAFARAGVGVVATQNITDPRLGPQGLDLMARGATATQCRDILVQNAAFAQFRQLAILDARGDTAVWSGAHTLGCHAVSTRANVASAGNLLAQEGVPDAVTRAFDESDESLPLGERLLVAMRAGLAAGGEAGPVRSAGMIVVAEQDWPLVDLRVDWDEAPIDRLAELWTVWRPQMNDYVTRCLNPLSAPSYGVPGDE